MKRLVSDDAHRRSTANGNFPGRLLAVMGGISIAVLVGVAGCQAMHQIGQGSARKAPPAATPVLQRTVGLFETVSPSTFAARDGNFGAVVEHALVNQISVIATVGLGAAPETLSVGVLPTGRWGLRRDRVSEDASTGRGVYGYVLMPPPTPAPGIPTPTPDTEITLEFTETSVNPAYKGTPQETAPPLRLVVRVLDPIATVKITKLVAPDATTGPFTVEWEAENAVYAQLRSGPLFNQLQPDQTQTSTWPTTLHGSKAWAGNWSNHTNEVEARDIWGNIAHMAKITWSQPAQQPCGGASYQNFTFCARCPSSVFPEPYEHTIQVVACSQAQAELKAETLAGPSCPLSANSC